MRKLKNPQVVRRVAVTKGRPKIAAVDETSGRVLVDAPDVVNGTQVSVFLNQQPTAWGVALVENQQAHVIGTHPLPQSYTLSRGGRTTKTTLLTADAT